MLENRYENKKGMGTMILLGVLLGVGAGIAVYYLLRNMEQYLPTPITRKVIYTLNKISTAWYQLTIYYNVTVDRSELWYYKYQRKGTDVDVKDNVQRHGLSWTWQAEVPLIRVWYKGEVFELRLFEKYPPHGLLVDGVYELRVTITPP